MDEYRHHTQGFPTVLRARPRTPHAKPVACRRQCKARGHLDWRALQPVADKKHRPAVGASQHDPPAPASNAPSFSVVSSVADSVLGGGAPAALASPRGSTSSARRSARSRSSAPPDVSMVVTRPLAGTGSTSQASHPGRRASSERRAGPSKPAGRTESIPRDPLSSGGQGGVGLSVTAVTKTASPCRVGSSQYAPHG